MTIVDAQIHMWGADTPRRPWPPGRAAEAQKPYPIGKEAVLFQMDLAGVRRAVIVPPSWEGDRNDVALDAARANPDRFGVMGRLAIEDPDSRDSVPTWREQTGMLGLRFTFSREEHRRTLTDRTADRIWPVIERAGIPVMMYMPAVCRLARHPGVAVKASGPPALSAEGYPFRDIHGHIRALFDAFGPRRTFWGTDLTRMPCTYYECITLFTQHLPWLEGADLDWVMGRGICEWLDWPL